jgi:hypothetical protein
MARIRTIKPEFFRHEGLFDAEEESGLPLRLAYIGLWTEVDREGRFEWRPRRLKTSILPYDGIDFNKVLEALDKYGFIKTYEVNSKKYGYIPTWKDHQVINQRESQSAIPAPDSNEAHVHAHALDFLDVHGYASANVPQTIKKIIFARDENRCVRCGATSDLTIDHIFPKSIGGTHAVTNLRLLCRACNSARPVAGEGLIEDLSKDGLNLNDMERICTHVHAHVEGKGKGKGNRKEQESNANALLVDSDAADPNPRQEILAEKPQEQTLKPDKPKLVPPPCPYQQIVDPTMRFYPCVLG